MGCRNHLLFSWLLCQMELKTLIFPRVCKDRIEKRIKPTQDFSSGDLWSRLSLPMQGAGSGINHKPLVGVTKIENKNKTFSVEHHNLGDKWSLATVRVRAAGVRSELSHLRPGLLQESACHLCWSGARGKKQPGPCLWLYPCPRLAGTRIIYDREVPDGVSKLTCVQDAPADPPTIPGVTSPTGDEPSRKPARITCAAAPRTSRQGSSGWEPLGSPSRKRKSGVGWVVQGARGSSCPVSSPEGEGRVWVQHFHWEPTFPEKGAQEVQARPFSLIR